MSGDVPLGKMTFSKALSSVEAFLFANLTSDLYNWNFKLSVYFQLITAVLLLTGTKVRIFYSVVHKVTFICRGLFGQKE